MSITGFRGRGVRPASQTATLPRPTAVPAPELADNWQPETLQRSRLKDAAEQQLVTKIHARVTASIGRAVDTASPEAVRGALAEQFPIALEAEKITLNRTDRLRLQDAVLAEIAGYGPIQDLILDDTISEIMVNGPTQVWIEREGKLYLTDITFTDADHVIRIIQRIVAPLGRRCDESSPMVDARLPDGSRVNAIIPPLSIIGPVLTVRKFSKRPLTVQMLIQYGTLTPEVAEFLSAAVRGQTNILVSVGTGSGKTTLLNVLSSCIPET